MDSNIEIVNERIDKEIEFKNLSIGAYFVHGEDLYVKVCLSKTEYGIDFNSFRLKNCALGNFRDDVLIKVVDVKIIYNFK